jgi:N-acetylneuraminic acid mutarotase
MYRKKNYKINKKECPARHQKFNNYNLGKRNQTFYNLYKPKKYIPTGTGTYLNHAVLKKSFHDSATCVNEI